MSDQQTSIDFKVVGDLQPRDREGGVLLVDHHSEDCATPCPIHDATNRTVAGYIRTIFLLRADLARARAVVEAAQRLRQASWPERQEPRLWRELDVVLDAHQPEPGAGQA